MFLLRQEVKVAALSPLAKLVALAVAVEAITETLPLVAVTSEVIVQVKAIAAVTLRALVAVVAVQARVAQLMDQVETERLGLMV
jgi:hypothetical protein